MGEVEGWTPGPYLEADRIIMMAASRPIEEPPPPLVLSRVWKGAVMLCPAEIDRVFIRVGGGQGSIVMPRKDPDGEGGGGMQGQREGKAGW